jgi:cytochrome c-type biogenesis protein CcmH
MTTAALKFSVQSWLGGCVLVLALVLVLLGPLAAQTQPQPLPQPQLQPQPISATQPALPAELPSVAIPAVAIPGVAMPTVAQPVSAQPEAPMSAPVQARWDHLAGELRCLVCQNESLASSNAELAVDLRREVRHLIEQGQSDADIRRFLVSRYGDFVLYKPEVKPVTWLLWFGPFVLLLLALVVALRLMRRAPVVPSPLTDRERERVRQLLES